MQVGRLLAIWKKEKGFFSPQLFHTITMDIAGPLPQTKSGNRFILSIIDVFSKYVSLYPVRNMHLETIIAILKKYWIPCFVTDGGSYFTGHEMKKFLNESGID